MIIIMQITRLKTWTTRFALKADGVTDPPDVPAAKATVKSQFEDKNVYYIYIN